MKEPQLKTSDFEAMVITAAAELAVRWLSERPDGGYMIDSHLAAGAGLELLVQIQPMPAIDLRLVDSDGSYVSIQKTTFSAEFGATVVKGSGV